MYKEETEEWKPMGHRSQDKLLKEIEKALSGPGLTEEELKELKELYGD